MRRRTRMSSRPPCAWAARSSRCRRARSRRASTGPRSSRTRPRRCAPGNTGRAVPASPICCRHRRASSAARVETTTGALLRGAPAADRVGYLVVSVAVTIVIMIVAMAVVLVGGLLTLVARVAVVVVLDAAEARRQARVAGADIGAALRIRAERALELHALRRNVVHVMRGDDLVGCHALLHPALERLQHIVIGVDDRPVDRAVAE